MSSIQQGSPKKRQASTTLSRTHEDHGTTPGPGTDDPDKRARTALHLDAPLSSAPFISTTLAVSTSSGPAAAPLSAAGLSSAASLAQHLPSFFSRCRLNAPTPAAVPICLPIPKISGTTRSQILISLVAGLDTASLTFPKSDDDEFFLFMELHAQYKWVTFNMSALSWVEAMSIFNAAIEKKKGVKVIRKMPRALMEKLEEIEKVIHTRLKNNNFKCMCSHCCRLSNCCIYADILPI